MTLELRDVLYLGASAVSVIVLLVRLDSASKEQTRQHSSLKTVVDAVADDVKKLNRAESAHGARLDNVEERVDKTEARLNLMARRG